MDPIAFLEDKIKGFVKSSSSFIDSVIHRISNRSPIEILKRLHGETMSDLMMLRDRQDQVERVLYNNKTSSGLFSGGASTRVRGDIEAVGGVLMTSGADQDPFGQAGISPGINVRLVLETTGREKDSLAAEFVARQNGDPDGVYGGGGDASGTALRLTKVSYAVNINDWLSAIVVPIEARFRDLANPADSSHQRHGLTELSFVGPPLLNHHNDAATGITVRRSIVTATMAQSISGVGRRQLYPDKFSYRFNTLCHIVCQLPRGFKISWMGLQQVRRETSTEGFSAHVEDVATATGCVALKLESELGESTRIGGWVEVNDGDPKYLQWAVDAFDDSADGLGWGVSVSGAAVEGDGHWRRLQGESYLKVNLGGNFSLKPGIAWTFDSDDDSRMLALMLRSNWSIF